MKNIELCDEAAAKLAQTYAMIGIPAFVLRTTDKGSVSVIGPKLDAEMVAKMLRAAADAYLAQSGSRPCNDSDG